MRAILYARVSLDEQADHFGLPSQLRDCRKRAQARGCTSVEELVDPGYLGSDLDRPDLTRLRELVKSGQVDIVIAHSPDRLSRKLGHQLLLRDEFERAGVTLEFVTTGTADTPETRALLGMTGVFAEYEREKIRERTLRGRCEKARQGFIVGGRVAFGYRYLGKADHERGKLVVDERQAHIVGQIFLWADEGVSERRIATLLNEAGARPSLALHWGRSSVSRILRNTTYVGEAHYYRHKRIEPENPDSEHKARKNKYTTLRERPEAEWITIQVPPIIDRSLFERVTARLRGNKTVFSGRPSRRYLLRGLLWCAKCGRRMHGDPNHGRPRYRCVGRDRLRIEAGRCLAHVNAQQLDAAVWKAVSEPFKEPDRLRALIERHRAVFTRPDGNRRVAKLQERIEQLKDRESRAVEAMLDASLVRQRELFRQKLAEIADERREIEQELKAFQPAPNASALNDVDAICREIRVIMGKLTSEQKQEFLRRIVEHITVADKEVEIRCTLPPSLVSSAQNRPQHENIVRARRRDLERALRSRLSPHIAKI
jgi:site-specific DNA recombinase